MDPKLLTLRNQQKNALRTNVKKELKKASDILDDGSDIDRERAEVSLKKLKSYRDNLKSLDEEILINLAEDIQAEEIASSTSFDDEIFEMVEKIEARLNTIDRNSFMSAASTKKTQSETCKNVSIKLPKLEIQKFSGDPLKWQEFWDSYSNAIHNNDQLTDSDKFNYLKGFLDDVAYGVADGYSLTAANYSTVIEMLKQRFGNPETAIFAHFDKMLGLPVASQKIEELQKIFDDCERHIRSLVALGLPEETFGRVFTPIILSKLPIFVRTELHRRNGATPWTIGRLRELLRDGIRARDLSQRAFATTSKESDSKNSKTAPDSKQKHHSDKNSKHHSTTSSLIGQTKSKVDIACAFCNEKHYSDQCKKFPDVNSRRGQLKGKCLLCLKSGHLLRDCRSEGVCFHCKKSGHHRSLCRKRFGNSKDTIAPAIDSVVEEDSDDSSQGHGSSETNMLSHGERTILQTAVTKVVGEKTCFPARLLLDTACSRSFITTELCNKIGAKCTGEEKISIAGFEDTKRKSNKYKVFEFEIVESDGTRLKITANATDTITCPVQKFPIDTKKHKFVKSLSLAEPLITQPEEVTIDIVIGGDYYFDIVHEERIRCSDGLMFLASSLGYVAAGRLEAEVTRKSCATSMLNALVKPRLDSNPQFDLEKFWKLEDIGIKDQCDQVQQDIALRHFNESITREDSRYHVKWPFKQNVTDLDDNYQLSLGRLRSLHKRLTKSPEILKKYDDIIQDQLKKEIIEVVPDSPDGEHIHYIPHHCVITPQNQTTKIRVVYDASSKSHPTQPSLNECVHQGPVLLTDLCGLLMRFRIHNVAISSDIEKAFLQVGLQKPDRDVTRFLWLKDPTVQVTDSNIIEYRFKRVPFGVKTSPFLLGGAVSHHLEQVDTPVAKDINDNIYVDNVFGGQDNTDNAIAYYKEAKDIFSSAKMNLREWYSNDAEFMSNVAESDRGKGEKPKVLGLSWDTRKDNISCSVHRSETIIDTKRKFLKEVASVFDPLGFFAPVVMKAKILMQSLWKKKFWWDDILPKDVQLEIQHVLNELYKIPEISIPRRYCGSLSNNSDAIELHCFCDASTKAYAAVVYARTKSGNTIKTDFIFAKCRLAPVKPLTVPKLELLAAVIGVRSMKFVASQLGVPISKKYLWSDSQCTLHWILGKQVTTTFVRNRIKEIKSSSDIEYRYVPSAQNPADLHSRGCDIPSLSGVTTRGKEPGCDIPSLSGVATRGKESSCSIPSLSGVSTARKIPVGDIPSLSGVSTGRKIPVGDIPSLSGVATRGKESSCSIPSLSGVSTGRKIPVDDIPRLSGVSTWWKGPEWLAQDEITWPKEFQTSSNIQEPQVEIQHCVIENTHYKNILERFSSLKKLVRVTAWILRFVKKCRKFQASSSETLSASEISDSRIFWLKLIQKSEFSSIDISNRKIPIVNQLNLFRDDNGFIRCRGRLQNSDIDNNTKFPILLPGKSHYFTSLVVIDIHQTLGHVGIKHTLSATRQNFWVPRGRSEIKRVIRKCRVCRRLTGKPFDIPNPPDLPKFRSTQQKPFSCVGIDYLGPLYIRNKDNSLQKVWVCLYTCAVVRLVHLDIVNDLSTEQFLLSFRRFIAMFTVPKIVISDNAKNFRCAQKTISKIWNNICNSAQVQNFAASKGIEWKFIVEQAPWMGGFYERMVGIVKKSLKASLDRKLVSFSELQTVVAEIVKIVNSRPLVYQNDEVCDDVLTPAHFILRHEPLFPEIPKNDDDFDPPSKNSLITEWKRIQSLVKCFWDSWHHDYLISLREHWKPSKKSPTSEFVPNVGTVVLVKSNLPRAQWSLGKITELLYSQDRACRSAKLRLSSGNEIRRPLKLLYPIEGDIIESKNNLKNIDTVPPLRPQRLAKLNAINKINNNFCKYKH